MGEIVYLRRNDAFTDSMVIAEATNNQHESVMRIIKQHKKNLEKFGIIDFSDLKSEKRGRPKKICYLNELQATLLITFLDNTETVVNFKVELVRQFYEMRKLLAEKHTQQWLESRLHGKLTRKAETDGIKDFIAYALSQGSEHADKYYMVFSSLANKLAGVKARDSASTIQLNNLAIYENIILQVIQEGIRAGIPYKTIYQNCKNRCEQAKEIALLA